MDGEHHTRNDCLGGDVSRLPVGVDDAGARRGERIQQLGAVGGGALSTLLEIAANEQREDEHRESIEVDGARVVDRIDDAAHVARGESERDGHVHVQGPRAQRRPRAGKEHAGRPEHGRRDDGEADPTEETLILRIETARTRAAVQRERREHDVRGDGAREPDAREHRPVLAAADGLTLDAAKRMRGISERVERAGNLRELHGRRIPDDARQRSFQLELGARDAVDNQWNALDEPDAGAAMHALEVQLDFRESAGKRANVEVVERRMVEFVVAAFRRMNGLEAALRQFVVSIEAVSVKNVEGHAATGAAELALRPLVDESLRHGQAAVRAEGVVSRRRRRRRRWGD